MVVPYQRHQKLRQLAQRSQSSSNLDILKNKPFWIWDKVQHEQEYYNKDGNCCFNHICNCPTQDV